MQTLIQKILTARVYDVAQVSPFEKMQRLSQRFKSNIWLKREDLQAVYSFKLRGAYNAVSHLSTEQRQRGIICASAGNHAQGVALSGQVLNIPATIVMPLIAPQLKIEACRSRGANVVLQGNTFDEACQHAYALRDEHNYTFIHPFDDPYVIAGQGTIGKEMLEQQPMLDAVFVPIGGGGLAAGIAAYIKFVAPHCKVIGVEPVDSSAMYDSIQAKKRITLNYVGTFADGVAVKLVGETTFALCQHYLDEIILVTSDEICASMKDIFEDTRAIAEPSGALALAGLKKYLQQYPGTLQYPSAILSGANLNFERLRYVVERTELGEQAEAILAVNIPEVAGSFKRFVERLENRRVTEFSYRYTHVKGATIFVGIHCPQKQLDKSQVIESLEKVGYLVADLSDNEVAKSHLRYMIGGKAPQIQDERFFRFDFPEYPGALKQFLEVMQEKWNISLFHYRYSGADYGEVLVGIQVPMSDYPAFDYFLSQLNYDYIEETHNPVFTLFV